MTTQPPDQVKNQDSALTVVDERLRAQTAAQRLYVNDIKVLEDELKWAKNQANEIENRGIFKSLFSSTSKDLTSLTRTQNSINEKMLLLIQETIKLNSFSRLGIEILIGDLRGYISKGFTDVNGHHIRLGKEGEALAEQTIFHLESISNSSKEIDGKVEQNAEDIKSLTASLELKSELDAKQDASIARLHELLAANGKLDDSQDAAIAILTVQNSSLESLVKVLRDTSEQQQLAFGNRVSDLDRSHANWRWILLATQCALLLWLAYLTWWR